MSPPWRNQSRSLQDKRVHWFIAGAGLFITGAAFVYSTLPKDAPPSSDKIIPFSDRRIAEQERSAAGALSGLSMVQKDGVPEKTDKERAQTAGQEIFGERPGKDGAGNSAEDELDPGEDERGDPLKELEDTVGKAEKRLDAFENAQKLEGGGFGGNPGSGADPGGSGIMMSAGDAPGASSSGDAPGEPLSGRKKAAIARGKSPVESRTLTAARGVSGRGGNPGSQFASVGKNAAGGGNFTSSAGGSGLSSTNPAGIGASATGAGTTGASGGGTSSGLTGASSEAGGVSGGGAGAGGDSGGGGAPAIDDTTLAAAGGPEDCDTLWQKCKTLLSDYDNLIDDSEGKVNTCTRTERVGKYGTKMTVDDICYNRVMSTTKKLKRNRDNAAAGCKRERNDCLDGE